MSFGHFLPCATLVVGVWHTGCNKKLPKMPFWHFQQVAHVEHGVDIWLRLALLLIFPHYHKARPPRTLQLLQWMFIQICYVTAENPGHHFAMSIAGEANVIFRGWLNHKLTGKYFVVRRVWHPLPLGPGISCKWVFDVSPRGLLYCYVAHCTWMSEGSEGSFWKGCRTLMLRPRMNSSFSSWKRSAQHQHQ